ncbi:MAG: phage terminase large subunit [Rhodospirillales bacterium]|nr:phage terminase large subunit [Rhodospirillales bacterium]
MRPGAIAPEYVSTVRRMAQLDLYDFTRWMFLQRRGYRWRHSEHHRQIASALQAVFDGQITRLIINIPPRYSKTEFAVNFIAWALGRVPDSEFIYTSYSARLATNSSWQARELVQHEAYADIFPAVQLRQDSQAKDEWRTTEGGIVYAAGAGGTITGYGAGKVRPSFGGAVIIDDAHKADEARSDQIRGKVIDWYQTTLQSRLNDPARTPVIVIMQRLHEMDLPGWMLSGGTGEKWHHLCLPAIRVESGQEVALWPEKHDLPTLQRMRAASPYMFSGQYQQDPAQPEGNIFKPGQMPIVEAVPPGEWQWVRGWDLASTVPEPGKDPDYTVGMKIGRQMTPSGPRFLIADVVRGQEGVDERDATILNTAGLDGKQARQSLPQDPGQAGKTQILYLTRSLAGFRVVSSPESGDKVTRAEPFAAQVNVGNVMMLRAPWNQDLINEMRMFPNGAHDDQVDAGSRAFAELIAPRRTVF